MISATKCNKALWQACLASAFRTALACTIVGCVTLYSPPAVVRRLFAFPAFSYVTVVIIIINDATLGDALRACWLAFYATVQSVGPAVLSLKLIGPARFSEATSAIAVAVAAFVVALPAESTHLVAKRIALGQVVLVYVIAYVNGVHTEPVMHPLRLAASTALGAVACVLALLLPCPRLACHEVKKNYKLLTQNTIKRLKLLVKAICEEDKTSALTSISHAKSLSTSRSKLLQIITRHQDGMKWEKPRIKFFKSNCMNPGERLQEVDTTLRGMELALKSINSFPINILNEDMKRGLNSLVQHVTLTIKETKHNLHGGSQSLTVPEPSTKSITKFLQSLHTIPTTHNDLPFYFYLFCAKLLHKKSITESPTSTIQEKPKGKKGNSSEGKENWANYLVTSLTSPNLKIATKCSLSVGLSVFMGQLYSRENGIWSGLPVAISFATGREPTFRVANLKLQGTVLGTVYGVLGCFVFERFMPIRFLSLLPWFLFSSFLQRSRMYGPAGGISAVIGAILILGRKGFGPPSEFAVIRIVEAFIGLSCSIFVDLLFMPKRASTCAKVELSNSFTTLGESIGSLGLAHDGSAQLEQSLRKMKVHVNEMRKFVVEAQAEPNFWFLPFNAACYNKLLGSFSKLGDILHLGAHALKFLQQEFQRIDEACWIEHVSVLEGDIGHLKELICSSIKCFGEISRMKSLGFVEKELEKKNISTSDIEMGKSPNSSICMVSGFGQDEIEKTIGSYLQHSRNVVDNLYGDEGEEELKSQVVTSLSALGFCLSALMRETMEIEEAMKELVQWENPSSEINLHEISCKLQALYK